MAMFIMLARLSAEGVRTLKNNPQRIQEVNQEVEQFGARVVQQYALLGPYDFITVLDAPDPETVSRVSVELASRGAATYETLTAISVDEFVSRLGGGGAQASSGSQQPTAGSTITEERTEGTATSTEGPAFEPSLSSREPTGTSPATEEDLPPRTSGIEEGVLPRREEAPSSTEGTSPRETEVTGDDPLRTEEESAPPGREGARRQPDREPEEERGLLDRARDAIMGEEEEPRRREGTDRPDRR